MASQATELLWESRTKRLKRFIELDAPRVITAHESALVIRAFNGNDRWRSVWWFIHMEITHYYRGEAAAFLYRLRYRLTGKDPDGVFTEQCDNCEAIIPDKRAGVDATGRVICCLACIMNPLGCRCVYGEFGVAETDIATLEPGAIE